MSFSGSEKIFYRHGRESFSTSLLMSFRTLTRYSLISVSYTHLLPRNGLSNSGKMVPTISPFSISYNGPNCCHGTYALSLIHILEIEKENINFDFLLKTLSNTTEMLCSDTVSYTHLLHGEFLPASRRYINDYIQYVKSDFLAGLGFGATQMLGENIGIYPFTVVPVLCSISWL